MSLLKEAYGKRSLTYYCLRIAWVEVLDEGDEIEFGAAVPLMPDAPDSAWVAQHNNSPYIKGKQPKPARGRQWDHMREDEPYIVRQPFQLTGSRWKPFSEIPAIPKLNPNGSQRVDEEWMRENMPDLEAPWIGNRKDNQDPDSSKYFRFERKRRAWYIRAQRTVLKSPIIPLIIRMNVFIFSAIALALGASIHHLSDDYNHLQGPSADMAIIVDAVAIIYILYITWDEYTGKPLGLRSARSKLRLILFDLFFIVFDAANLSLAFEALSDAQGSCTVAGSGNIGSAENDVICHRQQALAAVLLIALIAWLLTFSTSVLR